MTVIEWTPAYRLIPSRFPAVGIFDHVADPADLEVVFAVEALTNDRLRNELGALQLVPPEDRIAGPGSTPIMAAFTHLNPDGSRFSDGSYGVFYAAESADTALSEVGYHRARFLRHTGEGPIELDHRLYKVDVRDDLHELRGLRKKRPELYDPEHYAAAQAFARPLRANGSWGIVYESVRRAAGECVAVFKPRALTSCRQARHITLVWDGQRITHWYAKSMPHAMADSRDNGSD